MKKLNNEIIISAIEKLIIEYKSNFYSSHSQSNCSLCEIFLDTKGNCSKKCVNEVFRNTSSSLPCVSRIYDYSQLDWRFTDNNITLIEFWTEVLDMFKVSPTNINTNTVGFRNKVLLIAEKYK